MSTLVAMDWSPDLAMPPAEYDRMWSSLDAACETWGEGQFAATLAPTWARNPVFDEVLPALERACMSPGMARSVLQGYHGMDVREMAAAVRQPTLVLHGDPDSLVPKACGLDVAARIEGSKFSVLKGPDHLVWIHNHEWVPEVIETFLTGEHHRPQDSDRILTTIVFTDIVNSTAQLAAAGDSSWLRQLKDHDRRMDRLLDRFDGAPVKHTGDGRLVHFARPARAVRFAAEMISAAHECGLEIRAGIHTGECELTADGDLIGLAVNAAARIASTAGPGEVLTSSTVKDLVIGSGLTFRPGEDRQLKGLPGGWTLFSYAADRPGPPLGVRIRNRCTPAALGRRARRSRSTRRLIPHAPLLREEAPKNRSRLSEPSQVAGSGRAPHARYRSGL